MAITAKFDLKMTQIDTVNAKDRQSTALKKSPIRTITITTIMAEESHELVKQIGFQRGTSGAVYYAKR